MSAPRKLPLLAIVLTALATLLVAGCGVSGGDDAQAFEPTSATTSTPGTDAGPDRTTTTEAGKERSAEDQQMIDITKKTYMDLGMDEQDAECLAEGMVDTMNRGDDASDTGNIMDIVNECDISMDKLMDIGKGAGGSITEGMKLGLSTSLENAGLSEEQATCVADAYIAEYGADASAAQDPEKLQPLMEQCDVDPGDFKPGN